jgi:hypothetical protein
MPKFRIDVPEGVWEQATEPTCQQDCCHIDGATQMNNVLERYGCYTAIMAKIACLFAS